MARITLDIEDAGATLTELFEAWVALHALRTAVDRCGPVMIENDGNGYSFATGVDARGAFETSGAFSFQDAINDLSKCSPPPSGYRLGHFWKLQRATDHWAPTAEAMEAWLGDWWEVRFKTEREEVNNG